MARSIRRRLRPCGKGMTLPLACSMDDPLDGRWFLALEFMAPRASKECAGANGYGDSYLRAPPDSPPGSTYRVGKDFRSDPGVRGAVAIAAVHVPDGHCLLARTTPETLSRLASAALRFVRVQIRARSELQNDFFSLLMYDEVGKHQLARHSATSALPGREVFSVLILHGLG